MDHYVFVILSMEKYDLYGLYGSVCMEIMYGDYFCMDSWTFEYGYKFVQFLGFTEEFLLTLDVLKVRLVKP